MRTLLLLCLVLSALIVGCATQEEAPQVEAPTEEPQEDVAQQIDDSIIPENDSVEIGEMI
ncbi:MAG TPA: hypothetical protein VJH97_07495 [Candidatus Nanoarchaeia archaeon]|nr:hypothetical protein [Candidatus Nanoarchaeia archaeon]